MEKSEEPSHLLMNWRTGFWVGRYEFDCTIDLGQELLPKPSLGLLVPIEGLSKIILCRGADPNIRRQILLRIFSMTAGHDTAASGSR
jgi:hypothetical protein